MKIRLFLTVFCALFVLFPLSGAYKQGKILLDCRFTPKEVSADDLRPGSVMWEKDSGKEGGPALHLKSTTSAGTRNYPILLDPELCRGKRLMLEVRVKGLNLERGEKRHFAPNFMFRIRRRNVRKTRWAKVASELGSYDWKSFYCVEEIPQDLKSICIVLVLQECTGEAWIDRVVVSEALDAPDNGEKPFNAEAAKIRRGPYADPARDNRNGKRGFMSGRDMSESAVRTLKLWGANLVRYQMSPGKKIDVSTPEKYLSWLESKMREAETVRERCFRNGISIVLDLHRAPGGTRSKHASNMLSENTRFDVLEEAWNRLSRFFRGKPGIYAYDLLNEPSIRNSVWQEEVKRLIAVIRKNDPDTPIVVQSVDHFYTEDDKIIYGPHFYSPHDLTHEGVGRFTRWKYPGYINGVYWDKEQIRLALKPILDFQQKYNAKIFIGEFSCISWARGADQWVRDTVELFDEYGFDYTYHAFREWPPWSLEHEAVSVGKVKPSADNGRKRAILNSLKRNRKASQ